MSGADAPAPFRIAFDNARDPYTARNALGITSTGGGGGAPTDAQYITAASDPDLTNEMVLTDTATVTWDFSTPGQAKANASAGGGGGGNVSSSGTPVLGQYAKWVTSTTIQGVSPATVLSDIGAQPAGSYLTTAAAAATYQPLDADLTAIAALTGTNTIYYRSGSGAWSPVVVSTGLSFTGGNLTATGVANTPGGSTTQVQFNDAGAFGGDADLIWNKTTNLLTVNGNITITGGVGNSLAANAAIQGSLFRCLGTVAIFGTETTSGVVNLRPNTAANSTGQFQVQSSGTVVVLGNIELGATDTTLSRVSAGVVAIEGQNILTTATGQPLDADLTSLAAASATDAIYYRSAANTWSPVTVSTGLAFSGGNLTATGGGGGGTGLLAIQVFSAAGSTTYTPTAGMVNCLIEVCGAGGGGGGAGAAAGNNYTAGGGGSGGYSRAFKTAAQVGASQNVTVGAKGTGASNANGTAGGDSFVGANLAASLCGAKGGSGGGRVNATSSSPLGGAGGVATTGVGDLKAGGSSGGPGNYIGGGLAVYIGSGFGGSSYFGGATTGVIPPGSSGGVAGINAINYGSGGSGAAGYDTGAAKGGDGSDGIVIITEFR